VRQEAHDLVHGLFYLFNQVFILKPLSGSLQISDERVDAVAVLEVAQVKPVLRDVGGDLGHRRLQRLMLCRDTRDKLVLVCFIIILGGQL